MDTLDVLSTPLLSAQVGRRPSSGHRRPAQVTLRASVATRQYEGTLRGLLRGFAALSWTQIGARAGISSTPGQQRFQTHREVIEKDPFYAERFSETLSLAMEDCFGARG